MIKRLSSICFSLALASAAFADTGAKDVSSDEETSAATESAEGLEDFVESAIDAGLLAPTGVGAAGPDRLRLSKEELATLGVQCGGEYPLDFSVVRSLRRFNDMPTIYADTDGEVQAKLIADLKAKLALGLYSEASALIATAEGPEWTPYRQLIQLLDNRVRPDTRYFQALETCHPGAGLWRAVAQLVVFDPEGVESLAERLADVRRLPYNMREDLAVLSIPSLLIERRGDLGQQVLAMFTPEEIKNSTRLSALKTAIIDMPVGSESDDRLVMLMSRPKLKLAALLILVERDESLRPTIHSFVLEEAWNVLEASETQHDLDPILEFVIKHLGSEDLYAGLERMRALPVAARDDIRASIDTHTMIALEDYLSKDDPVDAFNALQTLDQFHGELPSTDRANQLRKQGARRAIELGLFSMVKHYLAPVDREPQVGLMLAQAAFWGHVNQDLFEVRDDYPTQAEINRMAGIRALQANVPAVAQAAFAGLAAYPSVQLELLEHGAVADNWTLWRRDLSDLVADLTDDEVERLDRVRTIQLATRDAAERARRTIKPYQIADLLNASRQTLSKPEAGATNEQ
ncbi:MAG: hypothetical protein AAFR51_18055 [Pseudomonadota bacterium]